MKEGQKFLTALARTSKAMSKSVRGNCEAHPIDAAWLLDPLARWSESAFGEEIFAQSAKGYVRYCVTVAKAQRDYETTGVYNPDSLAEIKQRVYEDPVYMIPYMWAAVLIYPFWPSMIDHIRVFREQFLNTLAANPRVLELGCGHGVLGLLSAEHRQDASVQGVDLSPSAIAIAEKLRTASKLGARVRVEIEDATQLHKREEAGEASYDGIIFAMLAEHLAEPRQLLDVVKRHLRPHGIVFFSTAIESPQPDHVYEFHCESEVMELAERAGLRARSMVSEGQHAAPDAKYRPRAVAMILEHL